MEWREFETADIFALEELALDTGSVEVPKATTNRRPKRRIRRREKHELEYLREKMKDLTRELDTLQSIKDFDTLACSKWEALARKQATESQLAYQENVRLKAGIQEQLKIVEGLERIFVKKPKLTVSFWKRVNICNAYLLLLCVFHRH